MCRIPCKLGLPLMLAIALVILLEKVWRLGVVVANASGAVAILAGAYVLLTNLQF